MNATRGQFWCFVRMLSWRSCYSPFKPWTCPQQHPLIWSFLTDLLSKPIWGIMAKIALIQQCPPRDFHPLNLRWLGQVLHRLRCPTSARGSSIMWSNFKSPRVKWMSNSWKKVKLADTGIVHVIVNFGYGLFLPTKSSLGIVMKFRKSSNVQELVFVLEVSLPDFYDLNLHV